MEQHPFTIGIIQDHATPDVAENLRRTEHLVREAARTGAQIVCLKELFQSEALFGGFAKHWQLPLGLTIIACVALMPNGVTGLPAQLRRGRVPVPHAG